MQTKITAHRLQLALEELRKELKEGDTTIEAIETVQETIQELYAENDIVVIFE
jgi:hypothetical protein